MTVNQPTRTLAALLAATAMLHTAPSRAGNYTYTTLDKPGLVVYAHGINSFGWVTGQLVDPITNDTGGWVYTGPGFGVELIKPPIDTTFTISEAINDKGVMAALYADPAGDTHLFAHTYASGKNKKITISGTHSVHPIAINKAGAITGSVYPGTTGGLSGFLHKGATTTLFDPPGSTETDPAAINSAGVVAGSYNGADHHTHGFIYKAGAFTTIDPPGSINTTISTINDSGAVGGAYIDSASMAHGFTRIGKKYTIYDFTGAIGTRVLAILANGQVMGSWIDFTGNNHGFNYLGIYFNIDYPGIGNAYITGISPNAYFTGNYYDAGGNEHAFVATCAADQVPCRQ